MALRDVIIKATSKPVPKVLTGLAGSTVTTTRYTKGRDAAGRPTNTPGNPIVDSKWYIVEITAAQSQRGWGLQSAAAAEAQLPYGTDVADLDVVRVTAGFLAGEKYEIEQIRHDELASMLIVALAPTGKTGV